MTGLPLDSAVERLRQAMVAMVTRTANEGRRDGRDRRRTDPKRPFNIYL